MKGNVPYYGATAIMDYVNKAIFDGTYVLMGEDGSVMRDDGLPFLQYVRGAFWANNHAHVMQGRGAYSSEMLYCFLSMTNVSEYVTGAVQLKISQSNMSKIPVVIPNEENGGFFRNTIGVLFDKLYVNREQTKTLAQLRDTLLPKLMSGELNVDDVKID